MHRNPQAICGANLLASRGEDQPNAARCREGSTPSTCYGFAMNRLSCFGIFNYTRWYRQADGPDQGRQRVLGKQIIRQADHQTIPRRYSAGSHPRGEIHPLAIYELERNGYATEGLLSKHWDEFAAPDAPRPDFVFTVCDRAAAESCPLWPGQPMTAH